MTKLIVTLDKSAEQESSDRAQRLKPSGPPMQLPPATTVIQFLRGVYARATMTLPSFYLFHGAKAVGDQPCSITGYPGVILKHAIEFSCLGTVSLSCRKVFDHAPKGLTGGNFAKTSDETLEKVGKYWSKTSKRPIQEALSALILLRSIFKDCAKSDRDLLTAAAPLSRRIGLLKQYANHSAAHLTLENYEFSTLDCVHVVAALTIIGEIIRSFDEPGSSPDYFDTLDEASLSAAKQLFPSTPDIRLFGNFKLEIQSRLCWQFGVDHGRQMLLEQLPYAIGWF